MRRTLSAVVIAATLLSVAACASERADVSVSATTPVAPADSSSGAPASPSAGDPTAPAGGNSAEVCAAALETSRESATAFVSELATSLEAASKGDTKGMEAARKKAEEVLDRWALDIRKQAARATDARLGAVLTEIASEVSRMEASVESIDEVRLNELQQRLEQLCAG
ncbi:MAG TPA: hypothetical protein VIL54_02325 [Natronosporangium sp.]